MNLLLYEYNFISLSSNKVNLIVSLENTPLVWKCLSVFTGSDWLN